MKVPRFRRINRGDLPRGDEGLEHLANVLNEPIEKVTLALQNNLSFSDNINAEIRTIELAHNTETEIRLTKIKGAPKGVIILWSELYDYCKIKWKISETDKIKLTVYWDTTPSAKYDVRILIVGE